MKKYNHIIIDGNNLFWRCFSRGLKKYLNVEGFHLFSGAIQENFDAIEQIKSSFAYESSIIYFCFDNPESTINLRKFLNENYKSHRFKKNAPKGLYKTLNIFVELLKYYSDNYRVISADSLEADDLTLPIIRSLDLNTNNRCLLISNDMDWARNLSFSEYCFWWNFDKMYNQKSFESEYKFPPTGKRVQLYKSIHGDTNDNIKNAVPNLPKDILLDILNRFDSVDDLFKNLWRQDYPLNWKKRIKDEERVIRANNDLIDFIEIDFDIKDHLWICEKNIKILQIFYEALDMKYESWMYTKKELKNRMFDKK